MTHPTEPRRLPVRGLIVSFFLLMMLLIWGGHRIWIVGATRGLNKQIAAYRAAGQPIEPEDFVVVLSGENAVPDLRAAIAAIDRTSEKWMTLHNAQSEPDLPLRPEEIEKFRALIAAHPTALPLLTSASTKTGVDWQIMYKTPVVYVLLPHLGEQRDLARFARIDALLAYTDGDHARAVQRIGEILFQRHAVGRQPVLVSHLLSIGLGMVAGDLVQQMVEDLRIGGERGAASPEQVRALIATLVDETSIAASQRDAFLGERMMQLDMARAVANGLIAANGTAAPPTVGQSAIGALIRPTALEDAALMMRHTTAMMDAVAAAPNWPAFNRTAPAFPARVQKVWWRHVVANRYMPSLNRAVETHYRALTDRRVTALLLALRLYAVDHGGRLPDALDALVPGYIPSLPDDPMSPTTQPLKYIAGPAALVYSVGENGVDDGGSEVSRSKQPSPHKWDKLDTVTHYKRKPRPPVGEFDDDNDNGELSIEPTTTTGPTSAPG